MSQFVAQRKIKGAGLTYYMPGEVIPDFESWSIHARKAHINLDLVKEIKDEKTSLPKPNVMQSKSELTITSMKPAPKAKFECEVCGKETKDSRSLKIHKTIKHGN